MRLPRHLQKKVESLKGVMDGKKIQYQVAINFQKKPLNNIYTLTEYGIVIVIQHYFELQQQYKFLDRKKLHATTIDNMKYYFLKDMRRCIAYVKESNEEFYKVFIQQ